MTTDVQGGEPFVKLKTVRRQKWLAILGVGAALSMGSPLQAQQEPSEEKAPRTCTVFTGEADSGGLQEIYAGCWGTGLDLGEASQFETYENSGLEATVAVLERNGRSRVLLLRPAVSGQPMIEDLGSVLAVSAGRSPLETIEGLSLDFSQFESTGVIGVEDEAQAESGQSQARGVEGSLQDEATDDANPAITPGEVNIGTMIANDPAVLAAQADQ